MIIANLHVKLISVVTINYSGMSLNRAHPSVQFWSFFLKLKRNFFVFTVEIETLFMKCKLIICEG